MRCAELSSSRSPYSTYGQKVRSGNDGDFAATPTAELVIIGIGNRMSGMIRQTWDCVRAADLSPI